MQQQQAYMEHLRRASMEQPAVSANLLASTSPAAFNFGLQAQQGLHQQGGMYPMLSANGLGNQSMPSQGYPAGGVMMYPFPNQQAQAGASSATHGLQAMPASMRPYKTERDASGQVMPPALDNKDDEFGRRQVLGFEGLGGTGGFVGQGVCVVYGLSCCCSMFVAYTHGEHRHAHTHTHTHTHTRTYVRCRAGNLISSSITLASLSGPIKSAVPSASAGRGHSRRLRRCRISTDVRPAGRILPISPHDGRQFGRGSGISPFRSGDDGWG